VRRLLPGLSAPAGPTGSRPQPSAAACAPEEAVRGGAHYLEALAVCHRLLRPQRYLEIGVRSGHSLALASCAAIAVDPAPELARELAATTRLFTVTSDEFFAEQGALLSQEPPDFAFVDGMHLFEYALRDFLNIERSCAPGCLVAVDDVFPSHPAQASRERHTRVWTGDVWKLHRTLAAHRPDLFLLPLDTLPTGLLLVAGLDPANTLLRDRYAELVSNASSAEDVPPAAVLQREGALPLGHPVVSAVLVALADLRRAAAPPGEVSARLRAVALDAARSPGRTGG